MPNAAIHRGIAETACFLWFIRLAAWPRGTPEEAWNGDIQAALVVFNHLLKVPTYW
jgi:hypothetical protein